jgi:hypothetical protein
MTNGRIRFALAALATLLGALSLAGCFDTTDKSPRKLRIFYSSDLVGSIEPCG